MTAHPPFKIVDRIPDGVYRVAPPTKGYHEDEMVQCAFCSHHQLHNLGSLVPLSDGSYARCGHECASSLGYAEEVKVIERDERAKRAKRLAEARKYDFYRECKELEEYWYAVEQVCNEVGTTFVEDCMAVLAHSGNPSLKVGKIRGGVKAMLVFAQRDLSAKQRDRIHEKYQLISSLCVEYRMMLAEVIRQLRLIGYGELERSSLAQSLGSKLSVTPRKATFFSVRDAHVRPISFDRDRLRLLSLPPLSTDLIK